MNDFDTLDKEYDIANDRFASLVLENQRLEREVERLKERLSKYEQSETDR